MICEAVAQATESVLPSTKFPAPPEVLQKSGRAQWERIWTQAQQWLCELDYGAVQRLCEMIDLRDAMVATVATDGMTSFGSTGQLVAHPLLRHIAEVNSELRRLEGELGVDPVRARRSGSARCARRPSSTR